MINLWLDDFRPPPPTYRNEPVWVWARRYQDAKYLLIKCEVDHCSLDHDLGGAETGDDLVKWMAENTWWPKRKPVVHSANPAGAEAMRATIERYWRQQ